MHAACQLRFVGFCYVKSDRETVLLLQAIQERHENSLLKSELDKLGEENKLLREAIKKGTCTNCGFGSSSKDVTTYIDEQQLRVENTKLKAEVVQLSVVQIH